MIVNKQCWEEWSLFGCWWIKESFSIASRFNSLNWSHKISLIVREKWLTCFEEDGSHTERVKLFELNFDDLGFGISHDKRLRLEKWGDIFNEEFEEEEADVGDNDGEWPSLDARLCLMDGWTGRKALWELPNCCFCRWWFKKILAGIWIWLFGKLLIDGLFLCCACDLSRRTFRIRANSGKRRMGLIVAIFELLFISNVPNEWRFVWSFIERLFRCVCRWGWLGLMESGIWSSDERWIGG